MFPTKTGAVPLRDGVLLVRRRDGWQARARLLHPIHEARVQEKRSVVMSLRSAARGLFDRIGLR